MTGIAHKAAGLIRSLGAALLISVIATATSEAATNLRMSTLAQPGSAGHRAAELFAERVKEATQGSIEITVYPGNQLGDWDEMHEFLARGSVDLALQPVSTRFEKELSITWFPYMVQDYESAKKAFGGDGYLFKAVEEILEDGSVKVLAPYAVGMGGGGFTRAVPEPRDPSAQQGLRIRVWPGGTTHRELMRRFGFNVATFPWAEISGALQTGLVEGLIGATPELAVENFESELKMWIQYNDHFELWWFIINPDLFSALAAADQEVMLTVARDIAEQSFDAAEMADQENLAELRAAGVEVVLLSDEELAEFTRVAREEVWPKIADEIGSQALDRIKMHLGLK